MVTTDYGGWQTAANALMGFGVAHQAVNTYYGVLSARYEANSQASAMEAGAETAAQNRRQAEADARLALVAGEQETGRVGLQYALVQGDLRARQGASGIVAGVGSSAEVMASVEYAKQADQITIGANTVRAANAARRTGVDEANRSRTLSASARNVRSAGRAMSPALAAGTSLIGSASMIASQWAVQQERSAYYRRSNG